MFNRQTTGSVVCPACGKLVGVQDDKCWSCGRRSPGMWGFASVLRRLGSDLGFAQLVIFACGLVWRSHVWKRVASGFRSRRKTGLVLFGVFLPMAVTGYLIQVTTSLTWSNVWIWVHVVASILWIVGYVVHQLTPPDPRAG